MVTDPYNKETFGRMMPMVKADIVTVSHFHPDHCSTEKISGSPFIIDGPGEYEKKGVEILGIASFHDKKNGSERGENTIYVYRMDGLKTCHLGDLGGKLSDKQVERLNEVDILMVPVGGIYTLNAEEAVLVVEQLEPKIVIPMHFKTRDLSFELEPLEKFLKEIGKENITPIGKLTVTPSSLPEEMEVIWLKK